jgi:hypothetical protein
MDPGFATWQDVLQVAVIPLSLAVISISWPSIQSWSRRRAFKHLILRELRELGPYPKEAIRGQSWVDHQRKEFIHRTIFENASQNRDFILSLPGDLCYPVSQLWSARRNCDPDQWLHYLSELSQSKYDNDGELKRIREEWAHILLSYNQLATGQYNP